MATLHPNLFKTACRICLQNNQGENMSSIFNVDADICDIHIYKTIEQLAGIEVLLDEKLPTLICIDCYRLLKVSYKFRTVCRNSNEYLKEFITKGLVSEKNEICIQPNALSISENDPNEINDTRDLLNQIIKSEGTSPVRPSTPDEFMSDLENKFETKASSGSGYEKCEDDLSCSSSIDIEKFESFSDENSIISKKDHQLQEREIEKRYECEICGNKYLRVKTLLAHIKKYNHKIVFKCEVCASTFNSNYELNCHLAYKHEEPYKCSFCPRTLKDETDLVEHERAHRNEMPFKCEDCDKSFSFLNELKYHKQTHTGEKPYSKRAYKKKKLWSADEGDLLISLWSVHIGDLRVCRQNSHIFREMAKRMKNSGFEFTPEEIRVKIHNLTNKYREEKRRVGSSGESSNWPLYERIHAIQESTNIIEKK